MLFKINKFRVDILDEADDISLCCISDVLSINLQDLVIGEEFLVGRSAYKSSWETQNQQLTCQRLSSLDLFKRSSPITEVYKKFSPVHFGLLSLQFFCTKKSKVMILKIALQKVISWSGCTMRNKSNPITDITCISLWSYPSVWKFSARNSNVSFEREKH